MKVASRNLTMMVSIILAVVLGLIMIFSYSTGSRSATYTLSDKLLRELSESAATRTAAYLSPAEQSNTDLGFWFREKGRLELSREQDRTFSFFESILSANRAYVMVYVADTDGNMLLGRRMPDGSFSRKFITRDSTGVHTRYEHQNRHYGTAYPDLQESLEKGYDPRLRPWYKLAMEKKTMYWTDVYLFASDRMPGFSCANPLYDDQGKLMGVACIDIGIKDLSRFLGALNITSNARVCISDSEGRIVAKRLKANETVDVLFREGMTDGVPVKELWNISNSPETLFKGAMDRFRDSMNGSTAPFSLNHGGEDFFASVNPIPSTKGLDLKIVLAIPDKDILGKVYENNLAVMIISLIFLVLLILFILLLYRAQEKSNRALMDRNRNIEDQLILFERIVALSPDMITLLDQNHRFMTANQAYLDFYGKKKEDLVGHSLSEVIGTENFNKYSLPNLRRVMQGEIVNYSVWVQSASGKRMFANITNSPYVNKEGLTAGVITSIRDITAQQNMQDELQKSESRYRKLVEKSPDAIAIHQEGKIVYVNPECIRLIAGADVTPDALIGKNIIDFVHPDSHTQTISRIAKVYREGEANEFIECRFLRYNGEPFDGITASVPMEFNGKPAIQTVFIDITERKHAEMALKDSRQRLTDIIDFLPDATFVIDRQGRVVAWNKAIEKLTGVPAEFMLGKGDREYAIPFYGERQDILIDLVFKPDSDLNTNYSHILKEGNTLIGETYVPSVQGKQLYLWGAATALYDRDGNCVGAIESIRDRTDRKLQEDTIHFQNALLTAQNEAFIDGILVVSNQKQVISYNKRFLELWDIPQELVEGGSDNDTWAALYDSLAEPEAFMAPVDYLHAHPDESHRDLIHLNNGRFFERYTAPIRGDNNTNYGRIWFFRDITDWKLTEAELTLKERELSKANMFAETALDLSVSGYWYIDFKDPDYMVLSSRVMDILGEAPGSDNRRHLRDQFLPLVAGVDPEKAKENQDSFHGALEGRYDRYEVTYPLRRAVDGAIVWVHSVGKIVKDAEGRPQMMLGVAQDVTEQKNLEKEIRHTNDLLMFILNTSPISIGIASESNIVFFNRTFENLFGLKTGETMKSLYVDPDDREVMLAQVAKEGFVKDRELRLWDKNHKEIDVLAAYYQMEFEENPCILVWLTDITYLKNLNTQLVASRDEAEKATRAKSDFLARMSHEIRTPMNAIIGLSQLTLQTDLSAKQEDYISKTLASARNLLKIINDILDFSKIEAGKLELEEISFNLDDVLESVTNQTAIYASEKGLELLFSIDDNVPLALTGDQLRLGQILMNLVSNAVKFTARGEVLVRVSLEEKKKQRCKLAFSISDTGIGMDSEQISELFQPFIQADISTTRKFGGTGLGLAICKRLTEMLGGKISVESVPGRGSTFRFTASFRMRKQDPKLLKVIPGDMQGLSVLVVDDNESSRLILRDYLEKYTWQVTLADSGAAALELMTQRIESGNKGFDLILMDWKMPGMDGIATANRMRSELRLESMPTIIMITAYGREEILQKAREAKLDGFLVKPVSSSVLLDTIMEAFGKHTEKRKFIDRALENRPEGFDAIRGARILLVEDNEVNRQVATEILSREGFWVSSAEDGAQAVFMVEDKGPDEWDLILMDLQMPVMDGYTATTEIRARYPDLPIIAMTADAMSGVAERCRQVGMNDYVSKPIDTMDLFNALTRWIQPGKRSAFVPLELAAEPASPVPHIRGLDTQLGITRTGGQAAFYVEMLKRFHGGQSKTVEDLESAIAAGDKVLATRIAHTLKGVAGNIGATAIQSAAASLEQHLSQGDFAPATEELESLARDLGDLLEQLDSAFSGHGPTDAASPAQPGVRGADSPELHADLVRLRDLLKGDKSEALDLFKSLQGDLEGLFHPDIMEYMKKELENFNFDPLPDIIDRKLVELGAK